jgi:hypothetical protein
MRWWQLAAGVWCRPGLRVRLGPHSFPGASRDTHDGLLDRIEIVDIDPDRATDPECGQRAVMRRRIDLVETSRYEAA